MNCFFYVHMCPPTLSQACPVAKSWLRHCFLSSIVQPSIQDKLDRRCVRKVHSLIVDPSCCTSTTLFQLLPLGRWPVVGKVLQCFTVSIRDAPIEFFSIPIRSDILIWIFPDTDSRYTAGYTGGKKWGKNSLKKWINFQFQAFIKCSNL